MAADHYIRHPDPVEGCWLCKMRSVSISPHAMPTRRDVKFSPTDQLEKNWHKDIPAYKRLVKDGLQPNSVDGAAELEKRADVKEQVNAHG